MSADEMKIFNHQFCNTYSDLYPFHLTRNNVSSLFIFSLTIFSTSLLKSRAFFSISFFSNSSIIFLAPERFATFSQVFSELQKYIFLEDPDIEIVLRVYLLFASDPFDPILETFTMAFSCNYFLKTGRCPNHKAFDSILPQQLILFFHQYRSSSYQISSQDFSQLRFPQFLS